MKEDLLHLHAQSCSRRARCCSMVHADMHVCVCAYDRYSFEPIVSQHVPAAVMFGEGPGFKHKNLRFERCNGM